MVFRPTDYSPAIRFLLKKPVPNRHLVGFLQSAEPGEMEVYVDDPAHPAGVMLLMDQVDDANARRRDVDIDAESEQAFVRLLEHLHDRSYFFTFHRSWMIPLLWQRFEKLSLNRSHYMRVSRETFISRAVKERVENIREIREADRPLLDGYPDEPPSLRKCFDYTVAKWRDGERALRMLGTFDSGRLAAWVQFWMGAGMCEVMNIHTHPDFRRRGYAAALLSIAVMAIFKDHQEAFYTAPDDNPASIQLAKSVGFRKHSSTYFFNGRLRAEEKK